MPYVATAPNDGGAGVADVVLSGMGYFLQDVGALGVFVGATVAYFGAVALANGVVRLIESVIDLHHRNKRRREAEARKTARALFAQGKSRPNTGGKHRFHGAGFTDITW